MREDLSREEVVAAVDAAVEELLDAARVGKPPVDALALARQHLAIPVLFEEAGPPQGRPGKRGQIIIRADQSAERNQWAAAHAVGQHLKPELLRRLGPDRAGGGASLANLVAYHLLVPTRWFAADAPALAYDLADLKERYATAGAEVIAVRLLDLPEPCIITVVDNGHVTRRRSNAWPVRKRLEPPELECQRYVHEYSRPRFVSTAGWTVQGWPFHRPDWKREILRSVVDPDAVSLAEESEARAADEW